MKRPIASIDGSLPSWGDRVLYHGEEYRVTSTYDDGTADLDNKNLYWAINVRLSELQRI